MVACEHANEASTPSVVMPAAEPTTTTSSSTQPDAPPPPAPKEVAKPAAAPKPEPKELECKQVGSFQTRAGPRWVCLDKVPERVRVTKDSK